MRSPSTVMLPAVGRVEPADEVEQRGLAGAGRAHQRDEVAARNVEVHAVQHLDRLAAAPVGLGDGADLDERAHRSGSITRTASPSFERGGGASTTRSPARSPVEHQALGRRPSAPASRRGARRRSLTTHEDPLAPPSARTASAGISTPPRRRPAGGRLGVQEGHAHAHVGHDARSFAAMAMRTFTVALLRSAVGMIAMTERGNLPVGIGVERGLHRLPGRSRG